MSIPADRSPRWEEGGASTRVRSSTPSHDGGTTAEALTDDLLVEIISRVPCSERWRCKCVCRRWLRLARTLPQSLAGFFCTTTSEERFPSHRQIDLLDCCNGLLLCRWHGVSSLSDDDFRYVVCNPVTEQWVALPDGPSHSRRADSLGTARLGFDPAVSPHFHVFMLLVGKCRYRNKPITGVDVYSSETGRWVHKEKGCDDDVRITGPQRPTVFLIVRLTGPELAAVFLNGYLHFDAVNAWSNPCLTAVDTEGETWMNFDAPVNQYPGFNFIQHSQARLHYASFADDGNKVIELVVYAVEDYNSKQ
ncbi:hypothetical protein ACQJBY_066485 [Aegilops geniculata]